MRVYLLLGTDLGDRHEMLRQAIAYIEQYIAPVVTRSSVYETASWGKTDEPDYLNQVLMVETQLPAAALLDKILDIEQRMGRVRKERWGARTIDIDILFYGNEVIQLSQLTVPHPQLHNRRFTLEPLEEIAPKLVHPVLHKNISTLKNELRDHLEVKKL